MTLFPGNGRVVRKVVYVDPHPIALFHERVLDTMWGRGLAGRDGYIRIGQPAPGGVGRYAGELGPLQDFRGGAFVGRVGRTNIRAGLNKGLPNTAPSPAAISPMLDLLAATQARP